MQVHETKYSKGSNYPYHIFITQHELNSLYDLLIKFSKDSCLENVTCFESKAVDRALWFAEKLQPFKSIEITFKN